MVSFTGSTATGRGVMAAARAARSRRCSWSWAASRPFVVLDDADFGGACSTSAFTVCMHAGQGCAITTRLLVPRARYDEAVELTAAARWARSARRPRPTPEPSCGPLISARQRERVQGYLDSAVAEGGTFACGGGRPRTGTAGSSSSRRSIAGARQRCAIAQEEIFGPVLVVIAYDGDDDAVRIANDSPYGLVGHRVQCRPRTGGRVRLADAGGHRQCQRRRLVLRRRAVRRIQAVRQRPRDGPGRLRGVPGSQNHCDSRQ